MRVAAVDIGTNTTRLLIGDLDAGRIATLDRRVVVTRLGAGVDEHGLLAGAPMDRTWAVLADYGAAIESWNVAATRAVATSAARDASNRDVFLDGAERALGVRPEVIDGTEEARLSFRGATSGAAEAGARLVVDIGGGSTEFVLGVEDVDYARSIDVGSVRVTERWLPDRPAAPSAVDVAAQRVTEALAPIGLPAVPQVAIGVAGTFTTLAGVYLDLPGYEPGLVHGTVLSVADIDALTARLAALTVEATMAIPAVDPGRAEVLLAGSVVAGAALRVTGMDRVTISESDLLDGIALGLAEGTL